MDVKNRDPKTIYFVYEEGCSSPYNKRPGSDVGFDLPAANAGTIAPWTFQKVETGVIIRPPKGYFFQVETRSSQGATGILKSRGIIDEGYTGTVKVMLFNFSNNPYEYAKGDMIAQLVLHKNYSGDFPIETIPFRETSDYLLYDDTPGPVRGKQGFGSSGKRITPY